MRVRHGPGTRRNIKFNDDDQTPYIDVCLPDEDNWHKIQHEEAKDYREKRNKEKERDARMSLEGTPDEALKWK